MRLSGDLPAHMHPICCVLSISLCTVQVYDAPQALNANSFLTRRAQLPLVDARALLVAPVDASDPNSAARCPLPTERIDELLNATRNEFSRPGAYCRCISLPCFLLYLLSAASLGWNICRDVWSLDNFARRLRSLMSLPVHD